MPPSRDANAPAAQPDPGGDPGSTQHLAELLRLLTEERARRGDGAATSDAAWRRIRTELVAAGASVGTVGRAREDATRTEPSRRPSDRRWTVRLRTAALFAVVLAGAAAALWTQHEQGRRLRDAVARTQALLGDARRHAAAGQPDETAPAVAAVRAAAAAVGDPTLRRALVAEADELARGAAERAALARRTAELAAWRLELARASAPPAGDDDWTDWAAVDRELTALFEAQGIAPDRGAVPGASPPVDLPVDLPVDAELLFALDEWARARRARGDAAGAGRIVRATMRLDPHPVRDALRAALLVPDADAVERLVGNSSILDDDATRLLAVARALRAVDRTLVVRDGDPLYLRLLHLTGDRYPEHPYVALELGRALRTANKPWNALRFFHAALALRPDSVPIRRELIALISRGIPDWAAVERVTREALRRHPDDPWFRRRLAQTLLLFALRRPLDEAAFVPTPATDARRVDEALTLLASAAEAQPRTDGFALWSAALVALGRDAEAETVARRGLALLDGSGPPPRAAARLWQDVGVAVDRRGLDGAEVALRRAREIAPDDARGVWLLADRVGRDRPDAAEALLTDFVAAQPATPSVELVRTKLAEILLDARKLVAAQRAAEQITAQRPHDPNGHRVLGRILRQRGFAERALEAFLTAYDNTEIDPARLSGPAIEILENIVALTEELESPDAAVARLLQEIRRAAVRTPGGSITTPSADPILHVLLGRVYHRSGDLIRATAALIDAIELGLEDPEVHFEVADLYEERRELQAARTWRQHAAEQWPDDPAAHRRLARTLLAMGRGVEAAAAAEECRRLAPTALWPRRLLADALMAAKEPNAAAAVIEEAIAMERDPDRVADPDDPPFDRWDATFGLSLLMFHQDAHYDVAERLLRLAVDIDPNVAEAWCNYGHSIWRQGRPAEALAPMRKGHELGLARGSDWRYPSAQWVEQIRREIEGR